MTSYLICGFLSFLLGFGGGNNKLPVKLSKAPVLLSKAYKPVKDKEEQEATKKEKKKADKKVEKKAEKKADKTSPESDADGGKKEDDGEGQNNETKDEKSDSSKSSNTLAPKERENGWFFSGGLGLSYKLRSTNSSMDQDIWGGLGMELSYKKNKKEMAKLVLQGIGQLDLDNSIEPIFYSLADTYKNQNRFELYTGYVDFNMELMDKKMTTRIRAGRQHRWEVAGIHFDGISARASYGQDRLVAEIYGGQPLRYFESAGSGNWLFGSTIGFRLTKKLFTALEYIHIRDETSSKTTIFEDDYYSIRARFYPMKNLLIRGKYTFVDDRPRRGEIHLRAGLPSLGVYYGGSLIWQSVTLKDYSTEFSQFFPILQEIAPYVYGRAFAMVDLLKHLIARGSFTFREVTNVDNLGVFNHSYQRVLVAVTGYDLWMKGLEASLSLSYWNASDNNDISSVDGEVAYVHQKKWRFALGTKYYLYRYKFNTNEERSRMRSIYAKASYKINKNASARVTYEAERENKAGTNNYFFFSLRYDF